MDLKTYLHEKRPSLSDSSLTTYNSILQSLHKKVFGNDSEIHLKNFDDTDKILEFLKDIPAPRRKTTLSALVVVSGGNDKYRNQMLDDIGEYNKNIKTQEKSLQQKESWVDFHDIKQKWDALKMKANYLYKRNDTNPSTLQEIQNFILLSVLGGLFTPPRRSLDWCSFKINEVHPKSDNYVDKKKKELVFNKYKTNKTYGEQRVPLPIELKKILDKWIKIDPNREYLFFDVNGAPLTSVKLNQRFVKIFGKKAAINQMRHSYLTNKFGDTIKQNEIISDTMKEMGSSPQQLQLYVKKD